MNFSSLRIWLLLSLVIAGTGLIQAAEYKDYTVRSLAVISRDERGLPLKYPRVLFYDRAARETYLIVSGNRELVIFTDDFYPVISVGLGRGLKGVSGVFASGDNLFFCLDQGTAKVGFLSVYDRALLPVGEITLKGFAESEHYKPQQVVFQDDFFYVVGIGSQGLLKFDREGVLVGRIIPSDEVLGVEEEAPVRAFTIDSQGRFFILSEEMGRIFVYSAAGEFLFKFGEKGGSSGKLSRPKALALDEALGLVYVIDYMRHTTNVYSLKGDYLFEFGGKGNGRGWFTFPSSISVDGAGRVWVADTFNARVQVFKVSRREPPATNLKSVEKIPTVAAEATVPALKVEPSLPEKNAAQEPTPEEPLKEDVTPVVPDLETDSLGLEEVLESDL